MRDASLFVVLVGCAPVPAVAPDMGADAPPHAGVCPSGDWVDCFPTSGIDWLSAVYDFRGQIIRGPSTLVPCGGDLLVRVVSGSPLAVYAASGPMQAREITRAWGLLPLSVLSAGCGDLDGNGEDDLLVAEEPADLRDATQGGVGNFPDLPIRIRVFLRRGMRFVETAALAAPAAPAFLGGYVNAGDLDGDGKADVIADARAIVGNAPVLVWLSSEGWGAPTKRIAYACSPWNVRILDFDRDGHLDVAFLCDGIGQPPSRLFLGDGHGGFTERAVAGVFGDGMLDAMGADVAPDGTTVVTNIGPQAVVDPGGGVRMDALRTTNLPGGGGDLVGFAPLFFSASGADWLLVSAGVDGSHDAPPHTQLYRRDGMKFVDEQARLGPVAAHNAESAFLAEIGGGRVAILGGYGEGPPQILRLPR